MLRAIAIIFGTVMLVVGVLGFIPVITPGNYLFGIFHVNFLHNLVHIATGFAALLCGLKSFDFSRLFFQAFGIVYGLLALLGLYYWSQPIFGVLANNFADTLLHAAIAAGSLYLGFTFGQNEGSRKIE